MKALVTNRTDRVMLAVTAFSGVMFLACVGLMASNYRPLLGKDALAQDLNKKVYMELRTGASVVKAQMGGLPDMIGESFSTFGSSRTMIPNFDLAVPVQGLINAGRSLISSER